MGTAQRAGVLSSMCRHMCSVSGVLPQVYCVSNATCVLHQVYCPKCTVSLLPHVYCIRCTASSKLCLYCMKCEVCTVSSVLCELSQEYTARVLHVLNAYVLSRCTSCVYCMCVLPQAALSLACRLGFATRLGDSDVLAGGTWGVMSWQVGHDTRHMGGY